ncbi:DUF11 domain-containing protein, partial [Sunxiuqinia sp. A32]|uniref:DUF11 domain-containing protein n=1 Tax=Sunxiuqinia sp. A32 TaxID=3461496 RepID=UPI0040467C29
MKNILNMRQLKYYFFKIAIVCGLLMVIAVPSYAQPAGLHIEIVGPDEATPGELVSYTITFWNEAGTNPQDAEVVVQLPDTTYFTYEASSDDGIHEVVGSTQTVTWTKNEKPELGNVTARRNLLTITGRFGSTNVSSMPDPGAYYMPTTQSSTIVTTNVTISDGVDFDPYSDSYSTDVLQFCGVTPPAGLDGAVKSSKGSYTIFQYVLTNNGNITDKFDVDVFEGTGDDQTGGTIYRVILDENQDTVSAINSETGSWTTPSIAPGSNYIFFVQVYVHQSPANTYDYTDILVSSTWDESSSPGCIAGPATITTFILNPQGPAISFNKTDSPDPVQAGGVLSYNLFISNAGDNAYGAVVTDTYDPLYIDHIISTDPATRAGTDNIWDLGDIGSAPVKIEIVAQLKTDIVDSTILVNNSTISYFEDAQKTEPGSETASCETTVHSAPDLQVTKIADKNEAYPGDAVLYTVRVENVGNYTATGVELIDDFDEIYSDISDGGTGDYTTTPGEIYWNAGTLAPGEFEEYTYELTIKDRSEFTQIVTPVTNYLNATLVETDRSSYNNTTSATVLVTLLPDLKIIIDGPASVNFGESYTYTLTISNIGMADATTVVVENTLPSGLTFSSVTPSDAGSESGGVVTWTIGDLAEGAAITRTIQVTADCSSSITELTDVASVYTTNNSNEPDLSNNDTTFVHNISDGEAPVADVASLPDLTGECGVTVSVAPTATDNCEGTITGTTTDPTTYSTQGTYSISWTYDDGNGNTSTQSQTVIVDDTTAPVADVASLPDLTGECGVTVSVAPTA